MSSLKQIYGRITNNKYTRKFPMFKPLTLDGTVSGDQSMSVDGSVTPVEFFTIPNVNNNLRFQI